MTQEARGDVQSTEHTLDGFDTEDKAPEPDDEDHAAKKPKRKRVRRPTKRSGCVAKALEG